METAAKLLKYISLLVPFLLMTGDVSAGDYHNQLSRQQDTTIATIACAQCHVMHGTQGGPSNTLIYTGGADVYAALLRASTLFGLCTFCHDGDPESIGAPDVFTATYNSSAGDFPDSVAEDEHKRHSILSADTDNATAPPGFVGTWSDITTLYDSGLNCHFCHDQHGNTNYRNLRPEPLDFLQRDPAVSGAKVTYNIGVWDAIGQPSMAEQTITDENQFYTSNMTYRKHDVNDNDTGEVIQISQFCGKCHMQFYGVGGSAFLGGSGGGAGDNGTNTQWIRHPVGGVSVGTGQTNQHAQPQAGLSADFRVIDRDGTNDSGDEQPFCLTCHRAHGSSNHTNLIFGPIGIDTTTGGGGTGSFGMRDTCQQCHNQ